MKPVLLIQPSLEGPGGGDGVAAWMAEALWRHCRLTVFTWKAMDSKKIDLYFGTELSGADIRWLSVPAAYRQLVDAIPFRHSLLEACVLLRLAQALEGPFALRIFALCEASLGEPGIQYVHIPWTLHPWSDVSPIWYGAPLSWLRKLYQGFCDLIWRHRPEEVEANLTLVNSEWTGGLYSSRYARAPQVLYPPAGGRFQEREWRDRQDSFLCVGRWAEDKRLELVISILEEVRRTYGELRLHLVGTPDSPGYARRIRALAEQGSDWIFLHEGITRSELSGLMERCRYGIHGKAEEHFGMGVAEMVRAGCLVFVPDGGGQVEIVARRPELLYRETEDAVKKITEVLGNRELAQELREVLRVSGEKFSSAAFQKSFLEIVSSRLES